MLRPLDDGIAEADHKKVYVAQQNVMSYSQSGQRSSSGKEAIIPGTRGSIAQNSPNDIVVLKNVHKTYLLGVEGVPALRGVDLNIQRGDFVVIVGKSGSGKSSMLNIIGTIDKPTRGDLILCGKRIKSTTKDSDLADLRLKHLGFVFQTFNLIDSMTARENVELPMTLLSDNAKLNAAKRHKVSESLLSRVGMQERMNHNPTELSGGEQQRVTIARSLANQPELLLLDEPTGDLDQENSDMVLRLLCELNLRDKVTMVMVTHDMHLKHFGNKVVHMLDGKVMREEIVDEELRKHHLGLLFKDSGGIDGIDSLLGGKSQADRDTGDSSSSTLSEELITSPYVSVEAGKSTRTVLKSPQDYLFSGIET
eukprot:g154.t1